VFLRGKKGLKRNSQTVIRFAPGAEKQSHHKWESKEGETIKPRKEGGVDDSKTITLSKK